jgi:tetratricopeptide (TPR) repeat protein
MSLGFLNALALATATRQQSWGRNPLLPEVLGVLWDAEVRDWDSTRKDSRWGIQSLSDVQVETAVVAVWLTGCFAGGRSQEVIGTLPAMNGCGEGLVGNLAHWVKTVMGPVMDTTTEAFLLPLSAFLRWPKSDQAFFLRTITSSDTRTVSAVLGNVIPAARVLGRVGRIVEVLVDSDVKRLQAAVELATGTDVYTRDVDLALARAVPICTIEREETDELLLLVGLGSLPHTRIALLVRLVYWLRQEGDLTVLALFLDTLANRLSEVGQRTEALVPAREAAAIYRRLVDSDTGNPRLYEPYLAGSLVNLSNKLSEVGQRTEALVPLEEALIIHRRLADSDTSNPDTYEPDFAMSLITLSKRLSEEGQRTEALVPAQEAATLYRHLVDSDRGNPRLYEPYLAGSLNELSNMLSEVGQREEALVPAQESAAIYRRLADPDTGNPNLFEPDLAMSLNTLANRLSDVGRSTEALAASRESVVIRRRLANPDTGNPKA